MQNFARKSQDFACWPGVYRLCVSLMESLLKTLRYSFINEALDFVGVHQERILQVNSRLTYTQINNTPGFHSVPLVRLFSPAVSECSAHGAEPGVFR